MKLLIISGRSGAGKSVTLRILEDLGYYCVDNLPLPLLPALITQLSGHERVAVSADIRNLPPLAEGQGQSEALTAALSLLPAHVTTELLYLDASDEVLQRRFSETRRPHPLLSRHDGSGSLSQAIEREQQLLAPLRHQASHSIDSGQLSIHQLADAVRLWLLGRKESELLILISSFGYKYGLPGEADFVFDARFLPNPHWEPDLRPLTGLDKPVQEYLQAEAAVTEYLSRLEELMRAWLPGLETNNRSTLSIAIGCTGGQHRSVYLAEQLAAKLRYQGRNVRLHHREQPELKSGA